MLLHLVKRYNTTRTKRWTYVAKVLGTGRIGKQCRDRYLNHIGPGVVKAPWTPEEDQMIIAAQQRLGNAWTRIAELIGNGRPPNGIKNRWNSCLRFRQHAAATTTDDAAVCGPRTLQVLPPQNTPPTLRFPQPQPQPQPQVQPGSFGAARPGLGGMSIMLPPLTALSPTAASPTQTQSSSSCSATTSPLLQPDAPAAPAAPFFALPPLRARSTPVAPSASVRAVLLTRPQNVLLPPPPPACPSPETGAAAVTLAALTSLSAL